MIATLIIIVLLVCLVGALYHCMDDRTFNEVFFREEPMNKYDGKFYCVWCNESSKLPVPKRRLEIKLANEFWNEYTLGDGRRVNVKWTAIKFEEDDDKLSPEGEPMLTVRGQILVDVLEKK